MLQRILFTGMSVGAMICMFIGKSNLCQWIGALVFIAISAISVFDIEFHISLSNNYYEEEEAEEN
jgi:hypothetical protein